MGDFVLTGGEIPAMALADCLCRMVPGVLPEESCYTDESHWDGLLEYPQYSRPEEMCIRDSPGGVRHGHLERRADVLPLPARSGTPWRGDALYAG